MNPRKLAYVFVSVFVTSRCNLNCPFCIYGKNEKDSRHQPWQEYEATVDSVEKILDHEANKRSLIVCLQGGEPVLNKDLPKMIRAARSRGKICGIISNGLLLPDCYSELLREGLADTQVSIYDHTFEKLQTILPELNGRQPVNASYPLTRTVLERSPEHVADVVEMCRATGCMSLKFNIVIPFFSGSQLDSSETIYEDHKDYDELKKQIRSRFPDYPLFFPGGSKRSLLLGKEKRCLNPWQFASYDAKGNLGLCCAHLPDPQGKYGNLFDDVNGGKWLSGVNTQVMCKLREELLSNSNDIPKLCEGCPHLSGESFSSRL